MPPGCTCKPRPALLAVVVHQQMLQSSGPSPRARADSGAVVRIVGPAHVDAVTGLDARIYVLRQLDNRMTDRTLVRSAPESESCVHVARVS